MPNTLEMTETTIIRQALALTAEKGWHGFSLMELADHLIDSPLPLRHIVTSKRDILELMNRHIDSFVKENMTLDPSLPLKDLLFDYFMLRFEWLEPHKAGIIRLYEDAQKDPDLILCCTLPLYRSLQHFFNDITRSSFSESVNTLKTIGFFVIYLYTMRVWKDDLDPEMTKTMSRLDQSLSRVIRIFDHQK